jgi:hypothetical protein
VLYLSAASAGRMTHHPPHVKETTDLGQYIGCIGSDLAFSRRAKDFLD